MKTRKVGCCGGGGRKGSWGDVGEARRAAGRTVESSKNEFLACRTVCSFEFLVSPLRGRNDLSRRVEKGFDWIQEKKKTSWRRETERRWILGKIPKNSKNLYLWASKEKKKMDLSLNEVFGRYWDRFYRHLKDLLVFSICYFLEFICLHLSGFMIF